MILLDTSIVSAFIKPHARQRTPHLLDEVAELLDKEGLSISFVTQYELRRGMEELLLRGQGRSKQVQLELFLDTAEVIGLDSPAGKGWELAAKLWAKGRVRDPAISLQDADLLIATTAAFHRRTLVTADARLAENLAKIEFPGEVRVLPMA